MKARVIIALITFLITSFVCFSQTAEELYLKGYSILKNQKNSYRADKFFDKAFEQGLSNSIMLFENGLRLSNTAQYEKAILWFDRAISYQPNDCEIWNQKGTAYLFLYELEEMLFCYNEVIKIDSTYLEAWSWRGHALFRLNLDSAALES